MTKQNDLQFRSARDRDLDRVQYMHRQLHQGRPPSGYRNSPVNAKKETYNCDGTLSTTSSTTVLHEDEMSAEMRKASSASSMSEKLKEDRKALPIYAYRDKLLKAVKEHQVLVILGETGSGKSTQIPQYLNEAGFTKHGMVACTQPRRVAVMGVAARVSREMGVTLGFEITGVVGCAWIATTVDGCYSNS